MTFLTEGQKKDLDKALAELSDAAQAQGACILYEMFVLGYTAATHKDGKAGSFYYPQRGVYVGLGSVNRTAEALDKMEQRLKRLEQQLVPGQDPDLVDALNLLKTLPYDEEDPRSCWGKRVRAYLKAIGEID